jgi:hypothetical protein
VCRLSFFSPRIFTANAAMSVAGFEVFPNLAFTAAVIGLSNFSTLSGVLKNCFALTSTAVEYASFLVAIPELSVFSDAIKLSILAIEVL